MLKIALSSFLNHFIHEQKIAFYNVLIGNRLNCVEGHAGTGKSHLLVALKQAYENEGYTVRAFGPDSATAQVLKDKGFATADNIYHFLFSANRENNLASNEDMLKQNYWKANQLKKGHPYFSDGKATKNKAAKKSLQIQKGKEIWLIDEATKLGNRPMLQILKFAKQYDAQVIFSGGTFQLPSVERGCLFDSLIKRYGSQKLENIQRQKSSSQKKITQKIAKGKMAGAINQLIASKSIIWVDSRQDGEAGTNSTLINKGSNDKGLERKLQDRERVIEEMVKKWASDRQAFPLSSSLMIACSNQKVRALNEMVRIYRKERGEISQVEFRCETQFGQIFVSQGDTLEFGSNHKELGVTNGMQGTLVKTSQNQFTVSIKDKKGKGREIIFDPNRYASFKLGYATTYFRS